VPTITSGKTSNPIQPNASSLDQNRRNWQRLASGAGQKLVQVVAPITNNGGIGLSFETSVFSVVGGVFSFTLLTTKGDLATYSTSPVRLPVGTDGYVLTANSGVASGVNWAAPTGGGPTFVDKEIPSGAINGTNTVFTLVHTPATGSEQVIVNGLMLYPGASHDYTITGSTITFTAGGTPQTGDWLFVNYRY
jgi:hypothetical protein